MAQVCVLLADHAEALEERLVVPDCRYHDHVSHSVADQAVDLQRDFQTGRVVEGYGTARSVRGIDGRRRITPIRQTQILRTLNPDKHPPKLHYSIPACGDHRIAWQNSFMISEPRKLELH